MISSDIVQHPLRFERFENKQNVLQSHLIDNEGGNLEIQVGIGKFKFFFVIKINV